MNCTDLGQCPRCAAYNRRPSKKKPPLPIPSISSLSPPPAPYQSRQGSSPPRFTIGWRPSSVTPPSLSTGLPLPASERGSAGFCTPVPASSKYSGPSAKSTWSWPAVVTNQLHPGSSVDRRLSVPMTRTASSVSSISPDSSYPPILPEFRPGMADSLPAPPTHSGHQPPHPPFPHTNNVAHTSTSPLMNVQSWASALAYPAPASPAPTHTAQTPSPTPVVCSSSVPDARPSTSPREDAQGVQGMLLDMLRTCEVMEHSLRSS